MTTILNTCRNGLKRSKTNYLLLTVRCLSTQTTKNARLAEVGKFSVPKDDGLYETGQLFLHRVFGYRGIILFPWRAKVYDRNSYMSTDTKPGDETSSTTTEAHTITNSDGEGKMLTKDEIKSILNTKPDESTTSTTDNTTTTTTTTTNSPLEDSKDDMTPPSKTPNRELSVKIQTYYQVLIDSRDCPHVRAQTEAVTFLSNKESNRNLYAISGLDYVSQEDVLPYSTSSRDRKPLRHDLFDKFLAYTGNSNSGISFKPTETLCTWQEKNHPWLELAEVHREITQDIRVTVMPFYMGCRYSPRTPVHWWRYSIRLENLGQYSVQLRERHWRIFALSGTLETVRGRGVVGQEPILNARSPAFQYSSHISLQAPSGHMWGTFLMEREDGHTFECRIPPFSLESFSNSDNGQYVE